MRDGLGLAGAEKVEGATDFWVSGGEAGGGKEGGVDLACFTSGKEGAGRGGTELAQKGESTGGGSGGGNKEGWNGRVRLSHFPGKVG